MPDKRVAGDLISSGVPGLDDILGGGLTPGRLYLLEGTPGAGKTTIALQFLLEGARRGESVLYVTLSETENEMRGVATSHGWSLEGVHIREMLPSQDSLQPDEQYTMFHPSEVELSETTHKILLDVDKLKPTCVVFDSLSELRLLAGNSLRYRRQILALKQFFAGRECTVLLLDDLTSMDHDLQVQSIAHAVLRLEQLNSDYGAARRRLRYPLRGVAFIGIPRLQDQHGRTAGVPRLEDWRARALPEGRLKSGFQVADAAGRRPSHGDVHAHHRPFRRGNHAAGQHLWSAASKKIPAAAFLFDEQRATFINRAIRSAWT
jgi:circadian clock protein KaiC